MHPRLTIRQLYALHPEGLRIAYYQRHYVWGQYRQGHEDAAQYLTECLIDAYRRKEAYFLQGITVSADHLVDGQQRLTYIYLLLRALGYTQIPTLKYDNRADAQAWLSQDSLDDIADNPKEESQDIYYYKHTLRTITTTIEAAGIDKAEFADYALDNIMIVYIRLEDDTSEIAIYQMMNGTKAPMLAQDVIKAEILRIASDPSQPNSYEWELNALRSRYTQQWDSWVRWWNMAAVRQYYATLSPQGIDLLIKLCIRSSNVSFVTPLTFDELREYMHRQDTHPYHAAKHIFERMLRVQRRFENAYADPTAYNRIRAILLLQCRTEAYRFLHLYFVDCVIDETELLRYYKLSFLGMNTTEIYNHEPECERFDDLLASLSMADVYHNDTKRDAFYLLLRLNIDEDIKLGRKFDFSVWNNRSLEHIYSKSKVWHTDASGKIYDGNDNQLHVSRRAIENDPTFMPRDKIVNHDGTALSEHCIGNLVLLYGQNNASFGNANFDKKKLMFLAPGDMTVFESRNLLHTVCVFAGNTWDHRSIVDNYNLTLKNLKIYYGFK